MTLPHALGQGARKYFQHHGCRCDECRLAENAYQRERRAAGLISSVDMRDPYQLPSFPWVDRDWHEHAACVGHPHPEWWFPIDAMPVVVERALAICARCPVRHRCRDDARSEKFGIWAGDISRLSRADQERYRKWKQGAAACALTPTTGQPIEGAP